jgi:hypothetical protein
MRLEERLGTLVLPLHYQVIKKKKKDLKHW